MSDNSHPTYNWLTDDWLKLKKQLILLMTQHTPVLLNKQEAYEPARFQHWQKTVLADIENRIGTDHTGLWKEAMSLLHDLPPLAKTLKTDFAKSATSNTSPQQILGQQLKYFLEDARRTLHALETGQSAARVKTWERVDRLSKALAREQEREQQQSIERCAEPHFTDVHHEIRNRHPGDYNYPQKLVTIRELFYIFCACCRKIVEGDERGVDAYTMTSHLAQVLTEQLFNGEAKDALLQALSQLSPEHREILDVAFHLGGITPGYISETAYIRDNNLNRSSYEIRKQQALEQLTRLFFDGAPHTITGEPS